MNNWGCSYDGSSYPECGVSGDGVKVDGNDVVIHSYDAGDSDDDDDDGGGWCHAKAPLPRVALENGAIADALAASTFNEPCAVATDVNGNVVVVQDMLTEQGARLGCFELVVISPEGGPQRTITDADGDRVWLRGACTNRLDQEGGVVRFNSDMSWDGDFALGGEPELCGIPTISIDRHGNIWCANFFGLQYITNTGLGMGNSEWLEYRFWQPYIMSLHALTRQSQQVVWTVLLVGQRLVEMDLKWALPEELWFYILYMIEAADLGKSPQLPAPAKNETVKRPVVNSHNLCTGVYDSEALADGGHLGVTPNVVGSVFNGGGMWADILGIRYGRHGESEPAYGLPGDRETNPRAVLREQHVYEAGMMWPAPDTNRRVQAVRDIEDGRTKLQTRWKRPALALGNTRSAPRSGKNKGRKAGWTHRSVQARQEQHEREHGRKGGHGRGRGGSSSSDTKRGEKKKKK